MKRHWKEGSVIVRSRIEDLLAHDSQSPAENWIQAAEIAWGAGFDIEPPPRTATDRVNELRAAKDFATLNKEYARHGLNFEHDREQRCLVRWQAMRRWAAEPSHEERRAEDAKRTDAERHEFEIEQRAQQILAAENRAALEKARKQARKELT